MIAPQKIIDGLFQDRDIIAERLYNFAVDSTSKFENNNPDGIYDDNISNSQTAAANLHSARTQKTGDIGTRIGGTTAKDNARTSIEKYLAIQILAAAVAFGGKQTPNFKETYPNGMESFYKVSKENFSINVEVLIVKALKFVDILGIPFKTTITSMFDTYSNANDTQLEAVSDVSTDITLEKAAALVLADQLTDNLCDVGHYNRRSKTALDTYFDFSLLYPAKQKEIHKGKPASHTETEVCGIEYSDGKRTHIHNQGAAILIFGMKLNGVKVGETFTLLPDQKANLAFKDYFSNGTSIYVINNTEIAGMFQLDIIF